MRGMLLLFHRILVIPHSVPGLGCLSLLAAMAGEHYDSQIGKSVEMITLVL